MAENTMPLFTAAGKYYVYVYRDPRPGKKSALIYVGKGTAANRRADVHWRERASNPIMSDSEKKAELEDLAVRLVEAIGQNPVPTSYLMWGADGNLKQKWIGQDGETWVNVLAEPKPPKAAKQADAAPAADAKAGA